MGQGCLENLWRAAVNLGQVSGGEALIASEQFITSIPCKSDRDMFSGQL